MSKETFCTSDSFAIIVRNGKINVVSRDLNEKKDKFILLCEKPDA